MSKVKKKNWKNGSDFWCIIYFAKKSSDEDQFLKTYTKKSAPTKRVSKKHSRIAGATTSSNRDLGVLIGKASKTWITPLRRFL